MNDFVAGDRVLHPEAGVGTVRKAGRQYYTIVFDDGREAMMRRDHPYLKPADSVSDLKAETEDAESRVWPESTFLMESDDEERHSMGSHWSPFFDDASVIMKRLQGIVGKAVPLMPGASPWWPKHCDALPPDWPRGAHLVWPDPMGGLGLTLMITPENNHLLSLYPFFPKGVQHQLMIHEITVWPSGVEAQITVDADGCPLSFFDTRYLNHREYYKAGYRYEFILSAIAYNAGIAKEKSIRVKHHPEVARWLAGSILDKQVVPAVEELCLEGAVCFSAIPEWDIDDYSFRVPVREVMSVEEILGQAGWIVQAPIFRLENEKNFDLNILITQRAWQSEKPPEIGMDIEGTLWLQGFLWHPVI